MRRTIFCTLLFIPLLLVASSVSFAGDSCTIVVSCTIPAIAGVNAPLVNEKELPPRNEKEEQNPATLLILQEEEKQEISSEGKSHLVILKTIYSR